MELFHGERAVCQQLSVSLCLKNLLGLEPRGPWGRGAADTRRGWETKLYSPQGAEV